MCELSYFLPMIIPFYGDAMMVPTLDNTDVTLVYFDAPTFLVNVRSVNYADARRYCTVTEFILSYVIPAFIHKEPPDDLFLDEPGCAFPFRDFLNYVLDEHSPCFTIDLKLVASIASFYGSDIVNLIDSESILAENRITCQRWDPSQYLLEIASPDQWAIILME